MAERKTYTAEDFKGCNGRRVLVEGVVCDPFPQSPHGVFVAFVPQPGTPSGEDHRALIQPSAIVEILPEEIGAGDFVTCRGGGGGVARVEHIKGGWAWLFSDHSNSGDLRSLSDLTLVERGQ